MCKRKRPLPFHPNYTCKTIVNISWNSCISVVIRGASGTTVQLLCRAGVGEELTEVSPESASGC